SRGPLTPAIGSRADAAGSSVLLDGGMCRSLYAYLPALGIQYHHLDLRDALDDRDEVETAAKVFSHCYGIASSLHTLETSEARVQRCLFARPGVAAGSPLDEER